MHSFRLLVFDLDGTLIDSRRDLADAANALILECGGRPLDVETVTGMVGEGAALLVSRALDAAGLAEVDQQTALPRFLELYDERLLVNTCLYDGTADALTGLARGATLALLTNKPQHHTVRILEGLGIAANFRWVVGGDTTHGRKPDPAGLHYLMSSAGCAPAETIMIGDSAIDLRTARAARVRCCLVRYGFGFKTASAQLAGDEILVDAPAELVRRVRSA